MRRTSVNGKKVDFSKIKDRIEEDEALKAVKQANEAFRQAGEATGEMHEALGKIRTKT